MSDATTALVLLGTVIALFVWDRLPVGIVAVGTAVALYATNLLTLDQAMAGFGDPVVVFIAAMFVVSEGIESTGITAWAGGAWLPSPQNDPPASSSARWRCARSRPR